VEPGPVFRVEVRQESAERAEVVVRGRLDGSTAVLLRSVLHPRATSGLRITVEVSGLSSLDAAGLRVLVAARRLAVARGGDVQVTGSTGRPGRVLHLVGLSAGTPS